MIECQIWGGRKVNFSWKLLVKFLIKNDEDRLYKQHLTMP